MRWWRRNEGFEWKDYVRTTVLVRRQQRRDKIEAARDAAVEGVKEAGRKGLAAGAAGAEAAGQAAVKIAKSAAEGAAGGAEKGLALAVRGAAAARSRIAVASEPLTSRLSRSRVSQALVAVAIISGAVAGVRTVQFGWDFDATLLAAVSACAGLLWLWPRVFANTPDADDEWAVRTERVVAAVDRAGSWLPIGAATLFALAGLWFAGPVVSRWIDRAALAPSAELKPPGNVAADSDTLKGAARAAGAGLMRVGNTLVRLDGLTMLDPAQSCRRADGTSWSCGASAQQALDKLARRRPVSCTLSGEADGIRSGTCLADGQDIGAALVRGGHAFSVGLLFSAYSNEEHAAREAQAGLWAGEPEQPDDWRERVFADAKAVAPGGCPIKGRIQRSNKYYLMPHSLDYARTSPREDRGERWFCSVEDAESAGFKPFGK